MWNKGKLDFLKKCFIVLGKDFFLLMFGIGKKFLQDTKVHFFSSLQLLWIFLN